MTSTKTITKKTRKIEFPVSNKLCRVRIEGITPSTGDSRYPIKKCLGEKLTVKAHIYTDGYDCLSAIIRLKHAKEKKWQDFPMFCENPGLDLWIGTIEIQKLGSYELSILGWINEIDSWYEKFTKKQHVSAVEKIDITEGISLIEKYAGKKKSKDSVSLQNELKKIKQKSEMKEQCLLIENLKKRYQHLFLEIPKNATVQDPPLKIMGERDRALYGAWYEMFPRSAKSEPSRGATFKEAEDRLSDIAHMGFNVLYLPPIHPIGKTHRKGPNNALKSTLSDPGSPWAIGSEEGGHKSIHPDLGDLKGFIHFRQTAEKIGLEVALDLAYQCSPDHPYVKEHPDWFKKRADGSIQYAENPPKKYQDIYPFHFECADWKNLWNELKSIVEFWVLQGVKIFRVDNPHTKSFRFWEWLINEIHKTNPEVIFLSEAFTRPTIIRSLAKIGFSQSYTYFTWRNTKKELIEFSNDWLTSSVKDYLRPNLFANTPDILHEFLQKGGRPAFMIRFILASTLGASYGIYGPVFELCENTPYPGREENMNSEKYEIRQWNWDRPGNIKDLIRKVNRIRQNNIALHRNETLRFYETTNENLLVYEKTSPDRKNVIITAVNLDPFHSQEGMVHIPFGRDSYKLTDLLTDTTYQWKGDSHYIRLDPQVCPAHLFQIKT